MDKGFNVMGLWEKIEELNGFDFVARSIWFCAGGHAFGLQKNGEVARQGRWIAGKIDNLRGEEFRQLCRRRLTEAGARWIEYDEVWLFSVFFQKLFRMEIVRSNAKAGRFGVGAQVANRGKVCVHGSNSFERFCQRQGEETHPGIEIERKRAFLAGHHRLQEIFDQEAVHLKKRKVVDVESKAACLVNKKARAGKFELIFLLVEQQQAI